MQISVLHVSSHKEPWSEEASALYEKKINYIIPYKNIELKSKKMEREDSARKTQLESEMILKSLNSSDFVILCDEKGRSFTSKAFSTKLVTALESGKKRVVFIIGGAFGVSESVRERSQMQISLSSLTLNHLVARTVLLEQIYRGLMIWKGRPYHNE